MIDDNLKKSIQTKFFFGQGREEEQVITKQSVTSLSLGLTAIQNAFNQIKAYTSNIGKIQKAVIAAKVVSKKEGAIEKGNLAPIQPSQGEITSLFPALTQSIEELQKTIQNLDLSQMGGGAQENESGGMGLLGTLAMGAAIGGIGYMAFSGGEAQAATPEPDPLPDLEPQPEPPAPRASEVAGEASRRVVERRIESEQSDTRRVQKQVTQEQQTERLTETVEKAVSRPTTVSKVAGPPATNNWTSNLTDYINQSVRASEARSAAAAAGGMMDAGGGEYTDDAGGGGEGGGVNPPTSGMAGLIYQTAKQRGYDDYMAIGFVSVAEKESGLRPRAENMNYSARRAREIFGPAAAQYAGDPVRFANYVYGPATRKGRQLGNRGPNDGWNYRGKGLVQVTGRNNYTALSRLAGHDLVRDPDALINNPQVAVRGMFAFYESPILGGGVVRGRKSARSQSEANRILTDATGGSAGWSGRSAFGRENLAKVNRFSARYSAGGLASADTSTARGGGGGNVSTGPIQRTDRGVRGMSSETAGRAIRQMGIAGTNGRLNANQLEGIGIGSLKAAPPAARAIRAMRAAAAREGINIGVTDAYRSFEAQEELKRRKPRLAARPGTSNHGWGLAFDLSDNGRGIQASSAAYRWLSANASRFGIYGPLARPFEIWHWEYRGGGAVAPATVPVTTPREQSVAAAPRLRTPAGTTINNAAATNPGTECRCPEPTVVPVATGAPTPSPTDYLRGVRPAQPTRRYNVNTTDDYRVYFNAA